MADDTLLTRLDDLEVKYVFQQDTIDSLNDTVTKQWRTIEQLQRTIQRLEGRIVELGEWQGAGGDEPPPPHY